MLGYRKADTQVVQVHVKKPKPFKWLRKLFRRMKFKHARFDDGKYSRGQKDIEKWHEDTPLANADYPDYRWQVVSKTKARKGRSRSRDPKPSPSSLESKVNLSPTKPPKHNHFQIRNGAAPQGPLTSASPFMDMDPLRRMLDNHHSCSRSGSGNAQTKTTALVEVHQRPAHCCSMRASADSRSYPAARSTWETFDQVELCQVHQQQGTLRHDSGNAGAEWLSCSDTHRSNNSQKANCSGHPSSAMPEKAIVALDGNDSRTLHLHNEPTSGLDQAHDHDQDNDLNHLKVFDKKKFNKKPKKRKSKRKRPRRKGKYVELENAPSIESLDSVHDPVNQNSRKSPHKSDTVRVRGREAVLNPLHSLAGGLRNLADAPVFHPSKYRGYSRFFDE